MSIEVMKMALEALEEAHVKPEHKQDEHKREQAITALRAAIAEASGQQAIAMRAPKAGDRVICIEDDSAGTVEFTSAAGGPHIKFDDGSYGLWSLRQFGELFCYATPPRSEWAGLTIGELSDLYNKHAKCQEEGMLVSGWLDFAAEHDALLKEKNT